MNGIQKPQCLVKVNPCGTDITSKVYKLLFLADGVQSNGWKQTPYLHVLGCLHLKGRNLLRAEKVSLLWIDTDNRSYVLFPCSQILNFMILMQRLKSGLGANDLQRWLYTIVKASSNGLQTSTTQTCICVTRENSMSCAMLNSFHIQ